MSKTQFTTNIDTILLRKIKIKALEQDTTVNKILEKLIQEYLGITTKSE